MKVCGIELKGSEAIICLLSKTDGLFSLPDCRVRSLPLSDPLDTASVRQFQFAFAKLMADYHVDKVVIRERPLKGKFAGGAVGFKMEAAIQLIDAIQVEVLSATTINDSLKSNPLPISFSETGLKVFQEPAFMVAFASFGEDSRSAEIRPKEAKAKVRRAEPKSEEVVDEARVEEEKPKAATSSLYKAKF